MAILKLTLYPAIYGAYTELYAGLSPEVTIEKSGCFSECTLYNIYRTSEANQTGQQFSHGDVSFRFDKILRQVPNQKLKEELGLQKGSGNGRRSKLSLTSNVTLIWEYFPTT
jgi:hypothetical protein